jgi:hypothetical protein
VNVFPYLYINKRKHNKRDTEKEESKKELESDKGIKRRYLVAIPLRESPDTTV